MPAIARSALVPYSPTQMFFLVNDVEDYPRFLDWCVGARVLERYDNVMVAQLRIRLAGIEQEFATRNVLEEPRRVSMALVRGPFRELAGQWSFRPLGDGCKVELELGFEFAHRFLDGAFRSRFARLGERLVTDFCARADDIYGSR